MECKELGIVYGAGNSGMYSDPEAELRSAQNDLRNKTSALGGNFVIMDVSNGGPGGTSLSGRALWCSPRHPDSRAGAGAPSTVAVATQATPTASAAPALPAASATSPGAAASAPAAPAASAASSESAEQRFRTLEDLRKKGLINDDEYQQRRKAILQSL